MRVALFGATGFLGRAVAAELAARGHEVQRLARKVEAGMEVADLAEAGTLARLRIEADAVINCAARVPTAPSTLGDYAGMCATNAIGAANLAAWATASGVRRIVHTSTLVVASRPWPVPLTEAASTYPTGPVAAYAASKLAGELIVAAIAAAADVSCSVLRLSALYGPGMSWIGVLPAFIDAALAGRRLRATDGTHADFLHVEDAARAVVRAVEVGPMGIINVASGEEISIAGLAALVVAACGAPRDSVDMERSPQARAVVDVTKMREVLGVEPQISLERGVVGLVAMRRRQADVG